MEQPPNVHEPLYTAVEDARFLDSLSPEYEELWVEVATTATQAEQKQSEYLLQLWTDEQAPRVFRDRALLALIGAPEALHELSISRRYGAWRLVSAERSLDSLRALDRYLDTEDLLDTLDRAFSYQEHHDKHLITGPQLLRLWLDLRLAGTLLESGLDERLDQLDLRKIAPKTDLNGNPLDPDRFPLVWDILYGDAWERSDKLQLWASVQLRRWLAWQEDRSAAAPQWLRTVPIEAGLQLYRAQIFQLESSETLRAAAIFGWRQLVGDARQAVLKVATLEDSTVRHSLLTYAMERADSTSSQVLVSPAEFSLASTIAIEAGDGTLFARIHEDYQRWLADQAARQVKNQLEREAAELRQQASPDFQRQAAVRLRFEGLLSAIESCID